MSMDPPPANWRELIKAERQRADAAAQRADAEAQRADAAHQRADRAEEKTTRTTLNAFLKACHIHLSIPLRVQLSRVHASSTVSVTSPIDRRCPRRLREWKSFDSSQRKLFDEISAVYHPELEAAPTPFPEEIFTKRLGDMVARDEVASEMDLRVHERSCVENMVRRIIDDAVQREEIAEKFGLHQGIEFQNHTNNLSDGAEEVSVRINGYDEADEIPKPKNADQICVVKRQFAGNTVAFLVEYKSPMKLPAKILRQGLQDGMDLEKDIIHRVKTSTDEGKKVEERAEYIVAAVITQLYSYMLEAGIEYGYLSTGEAYVFLRISSSSPDVVYYRLAEPKFDVKIDGDGFEDGAIALSAVSQAMCFCLRAVNSQRHNQEWRRDAQAKSLIWQVDPEKILANMTPVQRKPSPPPSAFKRPIPFKMNKPGEGLSRRASLRSAKTDQSRNSCAEDQIRTGSDSKDPSDDSDADTDINTMSPLAKKGHSASRTTKTAKSAQNANRNRDDDHRHRSYCSHKCMLGLRGRGALDPQCPNFPLHPRSDGLRHTINTYTFRTLLRDQLDRDMDNNCTPLDIQGARGALFKLTLASHGYSIIGKGTVHAFVPDLRHEGRIYKRLRQYQGVAVPVCLGNLDCVQPYYYDIGVRIVHFLLLSWGGEALNWHEYHECRKEIEELEDAVRALGVEHEDERCLNVLWDERSKQLMLIDFERATEIELEKTKTEPEETKTELEDTKSPVEAGPAKAKSPVKTRQEKMIMPLGQGSPNGTKKRKWEAEEIEDTDGIKLVGQAGDGMEFTDQNVDVPDGTSC